MVGTRPPLQFDAVLQSPPCGFTQESAERTRRGSSNSTEARQIQASRRLARRRPARLDKGAGIPDRRRRDAVNMLYSQRLQDTGRGWCAPSIGDVRNFNLIDWLCECICEWTLSAASISRTTANKISLSSSPYDAARHALAISTDFNSDHLANPLGTRSESVCSGRNDPWRIFGEVIDRRQCVGVRGEEADMTRFDGGWQRMEHC